MTLPILEKAWPVIHPRCRECGKPAQRAAVPYDGPDVYFCVHCLDALGLAHRSAVRTAALKIHRKKSKVRAA